MWKTVELPNIFVETVIFFSILWIELSKEQYLLDFFFFNNLKDFTVTFLQINPSFLYKHYFSKQ